MKIERKKSSKRDGKIERSSKKKLHTNPNEELQI